MLGNLLSYAVKIATCPIDVAESALDVVSGGDGSKRSRKQSDLSMFSDMRDGVCEGLEDLDD